MKNRKNKLLFMVVFAALLLIVAGLSLLAVPPETVEAGPPSQSGIERRGTIYLAKLRFIRSGGIEMEGNELKFDKDRDTSITADTDDQLDFKVGGSDIFTLTSSGLVITGGLDLNGNPLTLDADGDSTATADTDDQWDIALGGADIFILKQWGAATVTTSTTSHLLEIIDGSPVFTAGTNVYSALNIDLSIGNSTAGTNTVSAILIDDISADAQNTETAISIGGTGWDVGFDAGANTILNIGVAGTDFSSAGGLTLADALTVTAAGTFQNDLSVDDTFNIDDTAYTSVGAQTLDPTASVYLMSPATTLTLTLATTTSVAGDFVWFVSQVATDTVIVDTTATAGGGNRTLGTDGDVIGFLYDGSKWVEAFFSDNS